MDLVVDEVIAAPRGRLTVLASSAAGRDAIEISRYDRNGARDPSFGGGDGRVALSQRLFGEPCAVSAADAAFQRDGRLVVVGTGGCGGEGDATRVVTARLLPDGRLDRSFGHGGVQWLSFSPNCSLGRAVAIRRDGKILIAGSDDEGCGYPGYGRFGLARLTPAGRYDRSFDEDGRRRVLFRGSTASVNGMALLRRGRILLTGTANRLGRFRQGSIAVARLLPGGRLDPGFGRLGLARYDVPGLRSYANAATVTSDGHIAMAVNTRERASRRDRLGAMLLRSESRLETRFGRRGARIARFGGLREFTWSTAAMGDGFAVVGVTRQTASRHDFAVARFAGP